MADEHELLLRVALVVRDVLVEPEVLHLRLGER